MKRLVTTSALLGAAAFAVVTTAAGTEAANAAPACGTPVLTSSATHVSAGTSMTVTVKGQNFLCGAPAGATGTVAVGYQDNWDPGTPDSIKGNPPLPQKVTVNADGSFSVDLTISAPKSGASHLTISASGQESYTQKLTAIVNVDGAAGTGSSAPVTSGGQVPTAVPAGHVAPVASSGVNATEIVLGAAGAALLVGGGVAARRPTSSARG